MIREKDIKWYLEDPKRFTLMKPFTRGGYMNGHTYDKEDVLNNTVMETGFANLNLTPISQDLYITEYRPDLHYILLNKSLPKIKIKINGCTMPDGMMEITQTASFQKLIHAAHVRNLTANNLEFRLYSENPDDDINKRFDTIKQEWLWREREYDKYMAINTCKQLGNCATLFWFDKEANKYGVTNFSYEDGYQMTVNYDEYGIEVARSLFYMVDSNLVIEAYDNRKHYHCTSNTNGDGKWKVVETVHGFKGNPLLIKRGKVAWEYAETTIEMWELMTNIAAVTLKRFGTFALALWGELDENSLKRDNSTLILNLSADNTNGKQDVKVLDLPEPQTMDKYLKTLEEKISLFSSTTFITPKDISMTGSGGNGIALAMSNDYAVAVQSALDWKRYMSDMVMLHQQGLDLESNGTTHYGDLHIGAKIVPWSLETNNTMITNLQMESQILSTETLIDHLPHAAPDERNRIKRERGALVARNDKKSEEDAEKAGNIARNNNNIIRDNK